MNQFDSFKVLFLYCAFIFDLYKWCLFIIATRDLNDSATFKRQKLYLQIGFGAVQVALLIAFLTIVSLIIAESGNWDTQRF
jgi:hypothetical protein